MPKQKASENVKEFSRQIAMYMGVEWSEAFYQKMYRIHKGEQEPDPEEESAINAWKLAEENPHELASVGYRARGLRSTVDMLRRYMRSGIYSTHQTEKMFSAILSVIKS